MATSEASYNAKTEALEVVERFKEHVKGKTSRHITLLIAAYLDEEIH